MRTTYLINQHEKAIKILELSRTNTEQVEKRLQSYYLKTIESITEKAVLT